MYVDSASSLLLGFSTVGACECVGYTVQMKLKVAINKVLNTITKADVVRLPFSLQGP